jgi:putative SOS response-associated peptidase YedK
MCGRYTSTPRRDKLAKLFEALVTDRERDESYNVSPQSDVYVVLDDGEARKVDMLRWGFVPGWAKDIKIGNRMINARADSVTTSNAYKGAFKRRRAILPVDGFYEQIDHPIQAVSGLNHDLGLGARRRHRRGDSHRVVGDPDT